MKKSILKIMLIEDNPGDAELIREVLKDGRSDCILKRADRLSSALRLVEEESFDVILLDLGLPDSNGINALQAIQDKEPKLPVIVLTGLPDEDLPIKAISMGAQDYLVKGKIDSDLLYRSIRYAIERKKMVLELQEALSNVKQLSGLLPICSSCKNIRDDRGYWTRVESYIRDHSDAEFTHSVCPECTKKLYPEFYEQIMGKGEKKTDK
ncbi:MAG TPA: hypothetical protein DCP92_03990 [Nitrospiraceae bacterium]|nr:hypothetical protein [Nitrospiraceae bacterium]